MPGKSYTPYRLYEAVSGQPAPPCDRCPLKRRCAAERLACIPFAIYCNAVKVQRLGSRERRLRDPSRALYLKLFPGEKT